MRFFAAIIRRELASYFATPLALVFMSVFLVAAMAATFYLSGFFEVGQAELRGFFGFLPWLYLFFLPSLSMRLWAEERRLGTWDLLLSLPVSLWTIVLAKFCAAWALACLALVLTMPLWFSVMWLGEPDNGLVLAGYLGSALLAGAYLAIGVCLSACTRNQLIAFIFSVAVCFIFMLTGLGVVLEFVKNWVSPLVLDTLIGFSFLPHFEGILNGVIDVRACVFFISTIGIWLVATVIAVDMQRFNWQRAAQGRLRLLASPVLAYMLLGCIFVAGNIFATHALRTQRWDLTQNHLFTLSQGTKNILQALEEPITLQFFFSQRQASQWPVLSLYARRVRDLLEEIVVQADGKIVLETIAPAAFSEDEDTALAYGLDAQNNRDGDLIYFGLAGSNLVDSLEIIPFFAPNREAYLEYDIAQLIYNLANPRRPRLGVLSNLPLDTGAGGIMEALEGRTQPFLIYQELVDKYAVEFIVPTAYELPSGLDVLLIAHPRPLRDNLLYAIDQFVLRGGRAIVFLDPYSEVSLTAGPDGRPLAGAREASHLPRLLGAWGVGLRHDRIVADARRAQRVANTQDARRVLADYVVWLALGQEELARTELLSAQLDRLNLATTGALTHQPTPGQDWVPLITSSARAALLPLDFVRAQPTPDALQRRLADAFDARGPQQYVIGARLSGTLLSAFASPPALPENAPQGFERPPHLAQSDTPSNVVIVADSDIFDDRLWVDFRRFGDQRIAVPIADNAQFLLNAVDVLTGSHDLIGLRGREPSYRPFTRLEDLRRNAEAQFLQEEQAIYARIQDMNDALADISEKGGALTPQAQETQTLYRQELVKARAALRAVQAALRADIARTERLIIVLNMLLLPALLCLAWFVSPMLWRWASRRRGISQARLRATDAP